MSTSIEVKNLVKHFGNVKALDGVNLTIEKGVIFGLLGPNGAGKTSFINCILGLIDYDNGEIYINGSKHQPSSIDFKRMIGIVPQELAIYENLSAIDNLYFFGSIYGLKGRHLKERAAELLKLTGLFERRKNKVATYSGGMKRRLNLAVGLIHNPEIILMDEPTVGIDPQSRNLIYELIRSLKEKGVTILYTTHYIEEAEHLCDRIAIIDLGKIVADGSLDELIKVVGSYDRIQIDFKKSVSCDAFQGIFENALIDVDGCRLNISTQNGRERLPEIMRKIENCGYEIMSATVISPNLETVFLHLTGKDLRD